MTKNNLPNNQEQNITKASGESAPFSTKKLMRSLRKAGAHEELAAQILREVKGQFFEGMPSRRIFQIAFRLLRRHKGEAIAARYHLKQAIFDLGPSGYPFELFVGALMSKKGYQVTTGQTCLGQYLNHEVDIVADSSKKIILAECKYHSKPGIKSGVQVPLYIKSRFDDIIERWSLMQQHYNKEFEGWLFTNTQFSGDAMKYGRGIGLRLIGWGHPNKGNLENMIEELKVYPVTCLTSLTKAQKASLLEQDIILCTQLTEAGNELRKMGVPSSRYKNVMKEISDLIT